MALEGDFAIRTLSVVSLVALLLCLPGTAGAYSDWGWDPDDVNEGDSTVSLDLRMTRRDVSEQASGPRMLRVTSWVHGEHMGDWWTLLVRLDSRGNGRPDYLMTIWNGDMTGNSCVVRRLGTQHEREGRFASGDDWGRCRIEASAVHASKTIRWNVRSYNNSRLDRIIDKAPDAGWYR
jgi:hypothetical protein